MGWGGGAVRGAVDTPRFFLESVFEWYCTNPQGCSCVVGMERGCTLAKNVFGSLFLNFLDPPLLSKMVCENLRTFSEVLTFFPICNNDPFLKMFSSFQHLAK